MPLGPRTSDFAKAVRRFVKKIPYSRKTLSDCEQLIRSSGSIAANFIEAADALGKQDRLYHIRICRKESKETFLWIEMLQEQMSQSLLAESQGLLSECDELIRIFTSIAKTQESNLKA